MSSEVSPVAPSASASQTGSIRQLTTVQEDGYETNYILAVTTRTDPEKNESNARGRGRNHWSGHWVPLEVMVDNCADEHVCGPNDFYWIEVETSPNPNLEAANGQKITHYGQRAVKMKIEDGKNIIITFQVCDVKGPILSVGKFCDSDAKRKANFNMSGGELIHEKAGRIRVDRVKNHYAMKCC